MQDVTQIELVILGNEGALTFIDNAERTVTVEKPIERIVMLSTDSAEVGRSLGGKEKIVGVTTYLAKYGILSGYCSLADGRIILSSGLGSRVTHK